MNITKKADNKRKPGFVGAREQTQCRFCRRGIKYVDYKDIGTLQKLLTTAAKYTHASAAATVPAASGKRKKPLSGQDTWLCCRLQRRFEFYDKLFG